MNEVRIISGKFRGRKLRFDAVTDLRPTLGRVRETLFNWLQSDILEARVLDLYAGSGALAFEALSRGASAATLIESNRRAVASLRKNAQLLQLDAAVCRIQQTTAERHLNQVIHGRFDLVFMDPPFALAGEGLLSQLKTLTQGWLTEHAQVYLELPRQLAPELRAALEHRGYGISRDKRFGDCQVLLLRPPAAANSAGSS